MNDYLILVKKSDDYSRYSPGEMQKHLEDVLAWIDSLRKKNLFQDVRRLGDAQKKIPAQDPSLVLDGPFTETREVISGFFMIRAEHMEHALSIARECPSTAIGCDLEVREFKSLEA